MKKTIQSVITFGFVIMPIIFFYWWHHINYVEPPYLPNWKEQHNRLKSGPTVPEIFLNSGQDINDCMEVE